MQRDRQKGAITIAELADRFVREHVEAPLQTANRRGISTRGGSLH